MSASTSFNFDCSTDFDPAGDFEAFLRQAPGKWCVYLLSDADDRPVQLLCVRSLRYSLKRRLGADQPLPADGDPPLDQAAPGALRTRRVNLREIVRRVAWTRVDSAFEADIVYLDAARQFFPNAYRDMVGFRPAWFLHVNAEAPFPRYVRTTDLDARDGLLVGPIEDRGAAGVLIEEIADWFDLCRYYNVLCESPKGAPCAYKEMGKCPAPCDGSISMDQYRRLIDWSASCIVDPQPLLREQTARMRAAATELRFELAAKIKVHIDSLSQLGRGPYRYLRRLRDFQFLSIQHGPRNGRVKAFLITPGRVEEIAGIPIEPSRPGELMGLALTLAGERARDRVEDVGAERVGVVAHHLFQTRATPGAFIPLDILDEKAILKAYKDLLKQPAPEPAAEDDEGVVKELDAR